MQCVTLPRITELNPHLLCVLCGGYYIDATSIIECLHAFCKSCIVRYLETHKYCPICDVLVHKTEPLQNIRPDVIRQSIVYKLVPNLYKKEMCNRRNFYVQVNPQLHPSCSESKGEITETSNFFSLDDLINLSLEYVNSVNEKNIFFIASESKRYFRCRAAVTIKCLRKLLSIKYALGLEHEIHLFLDGNQLPDHFRLLDIAYISSWKRVGYIRILFEILTIDRIPVQTEEIAVPSKMETSANECSNEKDIEVTINSNCVEMKCLDSVPKTTFNNTDNVELSLNSDQKITLDNTENVESAECKTSITTNSLLELSISNSDSVENPSNDDIIADSDSKNDSTRKMSAVKEQDVDTKTETSVSLSSNDKVCPESSKNRELSQTNETKPKLDDNTIKMETNDPPIDRLASVAENVGEKHSITATVDERTNLSPVPAILSSKSNAADLVPVAKPIVKAYSNKNFKERKSERSEPLPPVPALRMIGEAANSLTLTTLSPRTTLKTTTISKVTKPSSAPRFSCPSSSLNNPLRPSQKTTTNLIPMYSKSPARNSTLKKTLGNVSILRIDPKTLSPIESTAPSSPSTSVVATNSSASRKMLPCRPTSSSSSFSNVNLYACANVPIRVPSPSFNKHPAVPLYPPYPTLERSSLHPMNELVRRMFPSFGFPPIDPTKTPVDPSICRLPTYPQSIPTALNHFLTRPPPIKQVKYEKNRRKQSPPVAARVTSLSTNDKVNVKGALNDAERCSKRTSSTITNGQIKEAIKRKNTEVSDFSINNIIPMDDAKRTLTHACTADGVDQVCDQGQPVLSSIDCESRKSS